MPYDPKIDHRRSVRLPGYDYSRAGAYFMTISTANRECSLGNITHGELALSEFGKIADDWFELTQNHFREVEIPYWVVMPNHIHMVVEILDPSTGGKTRTGEVSSPNASNSNTQGGETPPVPLQRDIDSLAAINGNMPLKLSRAAPPPPPRTGEVSSPNVSNAKALGGETPPVQPQKDFGCDLPINCGKNPLRSQAILILQAQKSVLAKVIAYYKYKSTKQINLLQKSAGTRFWHRNFYERIIRNEAEYGRILLYIEGNPQKWVEDQLHPDSPPNRFNRGN